mmetsp:Transcript_18485/g.33482  ORF Transcript_18485/g.33482 Transcript_18485/m.33482 type:complete len:165 (-) Transcript_18485:1440-1934(-)
MQSSPNSPPFNTEYAVMAVTAVNVEVVSDAEATDSDLQETLPSRKTCCTSKHRRWLKEKSSSVKAKAVEFDQKHHVVDRTKEKVSIAKAKAIEFEQKHQVIGRTKTKTKELNGKYKPVEKSKSLCRWAKTSMKKKADNDNAHYSEPSNNSNGSNVHFHQSRNEA